MECGGGLEIHCAGGKTATIAADYFETPMKARTGNFAVVPWHYKTPV
jgi:hypothetical protein